jgi:Uma2 family endonuclease
MVVAMSAPSSIPVIARPDISSLVTEDDTPVDNIYSEKQQRLLTEPLYGSWEGPPPEEPGERRPFVATANVGIFSTIEAPPIVPDVLVSLDVTFGPDILAKEHRTYLLWEFGKAPDLVIEIVSNREGEELTKKHRRYRRLLIPTYVVWDPGAHLGSTALHVFELRGSLYTRSSARFFESLGLGLVEWEGVFEGCACRWLRWCDAKGRLIPTGAERAEQERSRAEQERTRADRLAERLRALGIDPDTV